MITISERLQHLISLLGHNPNSFSKALGYSNNNVTIGRIINDTSKKPSVETLEKIFKTFPKVNPTWLLTGDGNPLLDKESSAIPRHIGIDETTKAPLITQYAYGGYLRGFADSEFREAQPIYVASKRYSGGNYVAFEVRGDSMDDGSKKSICNGDIVLGKELQKHYWTSKLHVPKVFVIVHRTEGITIKEITHHSVESGLIICHPYNSEHEDFELNLSDVVQLFYIKEIKRDV